MEVRRRLASWVRLPESDQRDSVERRLAWLAIAVGVANVVVLLVQARATVHSLYLNADYDTTFVIPALAGHAAAGSVVSLGAHAYYEAWWFERLTAGLPHSRFIWEAAPFAVEGTGIALVAWCAWRAIGAYAAVATGVALLSISDAWRLVLADPSGRVGTAVHAGALMAALLLARPDGARWNRWQIALAAFTIVFGAAGATDPLIAVTLVVPYILAPWVWWVADRSRAAASLGLYSLGTGVGALIGGALLTSLMHAEHVLHAYFPVAFLSLTDITGNLQTFVGDWTSLSGGSFFGASVNGASVLHLFLPGVLGLLALGGVLWALARRARRLAGQVAPVAVGEPTRVVYASFWGLALAINLALWLLTTVSSIGATGGDNYLLSGWIAACALLGAFARRRRVLWPVLAGVAIFGAVNFDTHLADGVPAYGFGPSQQAAAQIARFTTAHGAHIGYAGYWDSTPITWDQHLHELVYPITNISCSGASGLCPYFMGISSWYRPRPHVRTFLVTDSSPTVPGAFTLDPRRFGRPLAEAPLGQYTIYVYPYDIASKLGPSELP